ncbi:hypothetical protein [Saccharothrix xinjiangensis]|uniref:Lipoprotein LpqN n=1 Tax=Saccharothrix xinjiangensis TaxID=204798 RepID=A0ABV9Y749_9PSEU
MLCTGFHLMCRNWGPYRMSSRRTLPVVLVAVAPAAGCAGAPTGPPPALAENAATGSGHVPIPRTNVLLRLPDGLEVDPSLPGLARPGANTSVVVMSQPLVDTTPEEAREEMADGLSGPKARLQGMDMDEPRELDVAGHPAIAVTGEQLASGAVYRKAIVALFTEKTFVMMTGTIEPGDPLTANELLTTLTDARWSDETAAGDLGFELTPAPGYQRQEGSTSSVIITLDGETGPNAPSLVAAPSLGDNPVEEGEREEFARKRFTKLPSTPQVESVTEVEVAGLPGFELTGSNRAGVVTYGAVLFTEVGYLVITGRFDPDLHPDQVPAFQEMTRSLVLT